MTVWPVVDRFPNQFATQPPATKALKHVNVRKPRERHLVGDDPGEAYLTIVLVQADHPRSASHQELNRFSIAALRPVGAG